MNTKNKVLLSSLISMAVLSLTACGGGGSDPVAQHPDTDFFAPTISLNGDATVVIEEGELYVDAGATADDNVDGNVEVITSGYVDTGVAGAYTLTYTATDKAEAPNTAVKTRTVKVIKTSNFSEYNGKWISACQPVEITGHPGLKNMVKVMTISNRNIELHARAYGDGNTTCTGDASVRGTTRGRVVYTGEFLDGTYTGMNIDITQQDAFLDGDRISIENLATLMGSNTFPKFDIITKKSATQLLTGDRSTNNGSTMNQRPTTFNVTDTYNLKTN